MKNISWSTKKVEGGFEARVYEVISLEVPEAGRYAKLETIKTFVMPTRARAKAQAQRLTRYYKRAT